MRGRAWRFLPLLVLAVGLGACARLPGEEARSTAAAGAVRGFAAISAHGLPLGSAVAVASGRLLTNAHTLPEGLSRVQAQRGDGGPPVAAVVLARSRVMDLAVLGVAPGHFLPVPIEAGPVAAGELLVALGAPNAGPALAHGIVHLPDALLAGTGRGMTAWMGALMGYSGGPALDGQGRLRGLVTALLRPGMAPLLAALTGIDLGGMTRNREEREVFILSIAEAMAESERIAPESGAGPR
ncbi:trypsin-like peptidase domain-containing protein [Falsiroseomonas sp. E2-1-a20]|uniref:trypsin-like peptidase domain-containing protein n=1 Tax=Falsiroseomonas sp. E2-1-a20 TaxID=3239300 RepID=UPI003F2ACB85